MPEYHRCRFQPGGAQHHADDVTSKETHEHAEDNQHRHKSNESSYLGEDEVIGGVHSHDIERINLFSDTHRPNFRSYIEPTSPKE